MIIPDCLNGESIIVSSPEIFDEFQKALLTSGIIKS
jgi:hypothetical protein